YFNRRIAMRVGFDLEGPGGGSWSVDFRDGRSGVYDELGDCGYRYRFETRWLPAVLEGRVAWEDFFLSLRFTASRQPDIYNDHLLGLLKFACRESLDAVESYEVAVRAPDRIIVAAEGARYSVPRYCPHAGADLGDTSEVLPGHVLRCLNHYYEFDLETGRCLNGDSPPLDSRRLSTRSNTSA
ncbi:MAG: UDP-MurNAc hydroxylase, partial [Actinomycetota bacterium]|nr:UDP-MurNAc hydroxylase [Actinomycetota bacterium]